MDGRGDLTFKRKVDGFMNFLWNSEEKKFMGRSARSWAEITFFYIIFYSCLAGFFSAMIVVFYQTIDDHYPKLMGTDSLLKGNPGMGYKPKPDMKSTLIRFEKKKPETYEKYTKEISDFIESYKDQTNSVNCTAGTLREKQSEPCHVDIEALTSVCNKDNDYGYSTGEPCVLLKLNRIFNWIPEKYETSELPEDMPEDVRTNYDSKKQIWISCEGENPGDADNLGTPEYRPTQGFGLEFYPFENQKGYMSPVVFVKFTGVNTHIGVMVECKAWAKNIRHNRSLKEGSVHFEVLVD